MQVMSFAHCLLIVFVIGKYTDVFGKIFLVGGLSYLGVSFYEGIFHEGR